LYVGRTFDWRLNFAAFGLRTLSLSLRLQKWRTTLKVDSPTLLSYLASIERSLMPSNPSERERAIRGFCQRFADLVADGDFVAADSLAEWVMEFNKMSDEEFVEKYPGYY
jgi:hypothetical protein